MKKEITNQIMLITYADSMGKNLRELYSILRNYFEDVFGGIHMLPFFPSSGDRGFAPINYDEVDSAFGSWEDIEQFSERYYLMVDFMVNHISVRSEEFKDYLEQGDRSPYKEMFINWNDFWDNGEPTEQEMNRLYRRKDEGPFKRVALSDGTKVKLWNTFGPEQMDINPLASITKQYYARNLKHLAEYAALIRLDAFAYASKKPGTSCFFVEPEVWEVLRIATEPLENTGVEILPEIHENYKIQMKMSERGHWVYDFALPMLLLHGLYSGTCDRLVHWLEICPRKQFTTLDTHDGIGVVDVVGLLSEEEIDLVLDEINPLLKEAKKHIILPFGIKTDGKEAKMYQINCTYFSALKEDEDAYLLARVIQFFAPGIPQVYYVGLLAGKNDTDLIKQTHQGRDINRHYFTEEEIAETVQKPFLEKMYEIMRFRNTYPAFSGDFSVKKSNEEVFQIIWRKGDLAAALTADLAKRRFEITYVDEKDGKSKSIEGGKYGTDTISL